jgi:hypothetical protein
MNKYVPHVFVLPEDDANRQLANGFQHGLGLSYRRMQILPVAGGWQKVLDRFAEEHVPEMERNANRFMVLLIDFDKRRDRLEKVGDVVPDRLKDRVFVLGAWGEPEELRQNLGATYEAIGLALARDCRENTEATWTHRLLCHNAGELECLRHCVRPILFSDI